MFENYALECVIKSNKSELKGLEDLKDVIIYEGTKGRCEKYFSNAIIYEKLHDYNIYYYVVIRNISEIVIILFKNFNFL
jgi:hypothetical protein